MRGELVATSISSRIIVDTAQFRKINPNYARPRVIRATNSRRDSNIIDLDLFNWFDDDSPRSPPPSPRADPVKVDDVDINI